MKRFSFIPFAAGAAISLASCSSNEGQMPEPATDITIAVNAPVAAMTRAAVNLPEGYTMKCVLQLLDATNNKVGDQKSSDIEASTGQGTFVISADDQTKGATKAIFWADYRDSEGKSVYNTADLKAVGYNTTDFDLSNSAAMAATDAFCGKLESLKNGASVTLLRPFANVNFTPTNPDKVAAAKNMVVSYAAPSAFNILSGVATDNTNVTYTNASFDASQTPWFSTFVFSSTDQTTLQNPISIALSNGLDQIITIPAGKVPLNENFQVNVSAEIGDNQLEDITVNVDVNPGYDKPEAPKMQVGSYINAAGEAVATADEAVGIVFNLGALEGDEASLYGDAFAGKTIKGYAVALNNVESGRQTICGETPITGLEATSWKNGAEGTPSFLTAFKGQPFVDTFETWVQKYPATGNSTSGWYIPSLNQLQYWLDMLYPDHIGTEATGSAAFKALFSESNIFDRIAIAAVNYASCSINNNGNISIMRINVKDAAVIDVEAAQIVVTDASTQKALCRPMITIFE